MDPVEIPEDKNTPVIVRCVLCGGRLDPDTGVGNAHFDCVEFYER